MSTRGAIATGTVTEWNGVYQHSDSYPTYLGKHIWDTLHEPNGIAKYKDSIVSHPGGWSSWLHTCYCHDDYFSQRDGSCAKDSPHYSENAPDSRMTQEDADPLFIEWVYVLNEADNSLHILAGNWESRKGFRHVLTAPLDSAEPDWETLE